MELTDIELIYPTKGTSGESRAATDEISEVEKKAPSGKLRLKNEVQ